MNARIAAVDYYLPEATLTNDDLSREFPEWTVDKIADKTGIRTRHISGADEFSSDLAIGAGRTLLERTGVAPDSIDYLIVVTQSPDFFLPTTAALVHDGLGLRSDAGATDLNLGCSGYVYGLGMAKGLIESGQAATVLLITADTYTKFLNPADKSVRTIFGDGAAATLLTADGDAHAIEALTYGTDGSGARHLVVPSGGLRSGAGLAPRSDVGERALEASGYDLYMDGAEIFNFTIRVAPASLEAVLGKAGITIDDVDLFVFHQANAYMLEHLRRKLDLPAEKFAVLMGEVGNTVSSTIPIALADAERSGMLRPGMRVLVLGFGVGLSWGGAMLTWGASGDSRS